MIIRWVIQIICFEFNNTCHVIAGNLSAKPHGRFICHIWIQYGLCITVSTFLIYVYTQYVSFTHSTSSIQWSYDKVFYENIYLTDERFLSQVYLFSTELPWPDILLRNLEVVCQQFLNSLLFLSIKAIWNKKKSYILDFFNKFHCYTKNQKSRPIIVASLVDGNCVRFVGWKYSCVRHIDGFSHETLVTF